MLDKFLKVVSFHGTGEYEPIIKIRRIVNPNCYAFGISFSKNDHFHRWLEIDFIHWTIGIEIKKDRREIKQAKLNVDELIKTIGGDILPPNTFIKNEDDITRH